MNKISMLPLFAALAGCSHYSHTGADDGSHEIGSKGYAVRCDATPANQPGCYTAPPPFFLWPTERIPFRPNQG